MLHQLHPAQTVYRLQQGRQIGRRNGRPRRRIPSQPRRQTWNLGARTTL